MVTTSRRRRLGIVGTLAATAAAALVLAVAGPASAHVRVDGPVTAGGYGVLTFRVPTESDTASTVKLAVTFPKDTPIISVSTQPKAGWTASVATDKLAKPEKDDDGNTIDTYVSSVTWTAAAGAGIRRRRAEQLRQFREEHLISSALGTAGLAPVFGDKFLDVHAR